MESRPRCRYCDAPMLFFEVFGQPVNVGLPSMASTINMFPDASHAHPDSHFRRHSWCDLGPLLVTAKDSYSCNPSLLDCKLSNQQASQVMSRYNSTMMGALGIIDLELLTQITKWRTKPRSTTHYTL